MISPVYPHLNDMSAQELLKTSYEEYANPNEVKEMFKEFFLGELGELKKIRELLVSDNQQVGSQSSVRGHKESADYSYFVDMFALCEYSPPLSRMVLKHANVASLLTPVLMELQMSMLEDEKDLEVKKKMWVKGLKKEDADGDRVQAQNLFEVGGGRGRKRQRSNLHVRLQHLPPHCETSKSSASSITASDVGSVVQLNGTVIRTSQIRMLNEYKVFRCLNSKCGHEFRVYADMEQSDNAIVQPLVCLSQLGGEGKICGGNRFIEDESQHTYSDYQEIKIQESVTKLGIGMIPRSLCLILQHDLVDQCKPGDDVTVVGKIMARWDPVTPFLKPEMQMCLRADSVRVNNGDKDDNWEGVIVGGGEEQSNDLNAREMLKKGFREFWDNPHNKAAPIAARNYIVRAVCPKLYGMMTIKLSLLLTLVGGVGEDGGSVNNDGVGVDESKVAERQTGVVNSGGVVTSSSFGHSNGNNINDESSDEDDSSGDEAAPVQFWTSQSPQPESSGPNKRKSKNRTEQTLHQQRTDTVQQALHDNPQMLPPPPKQKSQAPRMKRRSQSHMLLVGDPGTGKSQFLRFANALSPRCVLTTGVGTTSAGLTCSAVRDKNEWTLEAGALVLADRGVCCIDEFGCIQERDRTTIHEAMEQQSLSVAKAGLICKLNCRATVLATTNPKGLYNDDKTLSENTGIGTPLLSRFDLVFVLLDTASTERDAKIATFLLNHAIKGHHGVSQSSEFEKSMNPNATSQNDARESQNFNDINELWGIEKLRGYIANIKELNPRLSRGARILLSRHYNECRKSVHGAKATVRLLESLIRLSQAHARLMYKEVVEVSDAVAVILIMESSASVVGGLGRRHFKDADSLGLYINPMESEFPEDDIADKSFSMQQDYILYRYRLLHLINKTDRDVNIPGVGLGFSDGNAAANFALAAQGVEGGDYEGEITEYDDLWGDVGGESRINDTTSFDPPLMTTNSPSDNQQPLIPNTLPSPIQLNASPPAMEKDVVVDFEYSWSRTIDTSFHPRDLNHPQKENNGDVQTTLNEICDPTEPTKKKPTKKKTKKRKSGD